jgi:putative phosphonate catabolism associated alcohol dehydrogenase
MKNCSEAICRSGAKTEMGHNATKGRLLVFHGAGRPIELRHCALPSLAEGEVLIRVTCCTVCGSDVHTYEGRRTTPCPTVLGHEILGQVAQLPSGQPVCDDQGQPLRIGDRVTWSVVVNCGDCFFCAHGLPQKCSHMFKYGHEAIVDHNPFSGGLADYCHLKRGTAIFRVPEGLPDIVACPANCATATSAAALRYAGDCDGCVVLVQGAGMLGLTVAALSAWAGAREVIVCDTQPQRLEIAHQFGATQTVLVREDLDALTNLVRTISDGRGVDIAFDMTGDPAALEAGIHLLRIGGRYVWVGAVYTARPTAISAEAIVRKLLSIQGVHNYMPEDLHRALEFLAKTHTRFSFEGLVSQTLRLEDADTIFSRSSSAGALRLAVRPE